MADLDQKLHIWWDAEHNVIHNESSGHIDARFAQETVDAIFELFDKHPGAGLLVSGDVPIYDQIAGSIFAHAMQDSRITRAAFLNSNDQIKQITQYLVKQFPDICEISFFDSEEEAINWLNERG